MVPSPQHIGTRRGRSQDRHQPRQKSSLQRRSSFVVFCAVVCAAVQLAITPLTHLLHVHCGCSGHRHHISASEHDTAGHDSSIQAATSSHALCICATQSLPGERRQANTSQKRQRSPAPDHRRPHDSHSCRICSAAFALTIAEFAAPVLSMSTAERMRSDCDVQSPLRTEVFCPPVRGPPQTASQNTRMSLLAHRVPPC